ncbi:MAG: hypothetical protein M1831_001361 [Alyxoria varia]|nr:MAG: hypothetical protein M1831_001361 [Alyxoria varia]
MKMEASRNIVYWMLQYAHAIGARVLGIDSGDNKQERVLAAGAEQYLDFRAVADPIATAQQLTDGGAHGVVVTAGNSKAYAQAAEMLRIGGTLSCVGIPPDRGFFQTAVATFVIKGLKVSGNLVGSLKENLEALDFVRRGAVKPHIVVRPFKDLPRVYEELEKDQVAGRVVLKIAEDDGSTSEAVRARL